MNHCRLSYLDRAQCSRLRCIGACLLFLACLGAPSPAQAHALQRYLAWFGPIYRPSVKELMRYQRHLLLAAWMPPVKIQSPSSPKPADLSPPTWRLSQKIGQLPWPTVGTLFSFSSPKKLTGLRFRAPPGTPVRAIAPGTVVYSGPLAGYGPVVIIDHYDGYHTVMAGIRPQKIKVGRVVDPGTQIATIAMPNDHTHPGLYFEIRKEGMLTNAKRFLRSKSS